MERRKPPPLNFSLVGVIKRGPRVPNRLVIQVLDEVFTDWSAILSDITLKAAEGVFLPVEIDEMVEQARDSFDARLKAKYKADRGPAPVFSEELGEWMPVEETQVSKGRLKYILKVEFDKLREELPDMKDGHADEPEIFMAKIEEAKKELVRAHRSIVAQLNYPQLDTLPDLPFLKAFHNLSILDTIQYRQVCPRFKTILDEKCRQMRTLKIFTVPDTDAYDFSVQLKYDYCTKMFTLKLPGHENPNLHLFSPGYDDDLTVVADKWIKDTQMGGHIGAIFPYIDCFVLNGFREAPVPSELFSQLSTLAVSWAPTLTTLVLDFYQPNEPAWWLALVEFTNLSRLYLIYSKTANDEFSIEEDSTAFGAAQAVLGRLECFTVDYLYLELLKMLNPAKMTQLHIESSSNSRQLFETFGQPQVEVPPANVFWNYICGRLTKLTYVHVPAFENYALLDLVRQLSYLEHLTELSFGRGSALPAIAQLYQQCAVLGSVKKVIIHMFDTTITPEQIYALCPNMDHLVLAESSETDLAFFRDAYTERNINVVNSLEGLEHMVGPYWQEFHEYWINGLAIHEDLL